MGQDQLFVDRLKRLSASRAAAQLFHVPGSASARTVGASPLDLSQHVSGRHEFAFAVAGRWRLKTAERELPLTQGDLLLIDPGVDHVELPSDPPCAYEVCWCVLDNSYATLRHTIFSPSEGIRDGPMIDLHGRTNVQSLAVAIGVEMGNQDWGWQQSVRALLRYLGCILIRRVQRGQSILFSPAESPAVAHDPGAWEVIHSALAYCREHFREGLRVEDVARAVSYSESRLSHLFSAHLGQSVAEHVRSLRLAHARMLLETTDLTVAEIARQVGYGDPAHFTRAFIRFQQASPSDYRRKLRGL